MFILSAVLEIRPIGCTFQALGYISKRLRAKRQSFHGNSNMYSFHLGRSFDQLQDFFQTLR